MRTKTILSIFWICLSVLSGFAQTGNPRLYFDKSGKSSSEEVGYYYRQETDTQGYYKSYFLANGNLAFQGKIKSASQQDENQNTYSGQCTWYYKNGNHRQTRTFDENGRETGISRYYYESGNIWKEIRYFNGRSDDSRIEYDEDGSKNRIFEEEFLNNSNEWELYSSDKSSAVLDNGFLQMAAYSKEGTSRFINHVMESDEYTVEASVNISTIKDNDKVGILFGFKDWQNYHYFVLGKNCIYIGSVYEGVKSNDLNAGFCSAINLLQNNTIKILCAGGKNYFSVNGEIQYKDDDRRLYGNNFGFILSGNSTLKVDRFIIKEMGLSSGGASEKSAAATDKDVKGTGSGIIISSSGYIVTNHHVVEHAKKIIVDINNSGSGKTSYNADLILIDKDNDLAILKIKDEAFATLPPLNYAFKENGLLEVGSSVFTIGYPHALSGMGKEAKFTDGRISAKTGYNGAINSFQTTIPVQPGNSGGPVFNDGGQLVGIINASIREADNVSYAIKLNYIKNLIELLNEKVELPSNTSAGHLSLEEKIKLFTTNVVLVKIK